MPSNVIEFDPLTVIFYFILIVIAGYIALRVWRYLSRTTPLMEKRGIVKDIFRFNRLPTVPTIRIVSRGGLLALELGKRAKLGDNSLKDTMESKGWDIKSTPIPILDGKNMELGYVTHPSGVTLELRPIVKQIRADDDGRPVFVTVAEVDDEGKEKLDENGKPVLIQKPDYVEMAFEGVIGVGSDLDDFNESTEREISRGWVVPLLVGIIAGVVFFAPLFAWLMSWVAGMGK